MGSQQQQRLARVLAGIGTAIELQLGIYTIRSETKN
jgi:hypothetical protein